MVVNTNEIKTIGSIYGRIPATKQIASLHVRLAGDNRLRHVRDEQFLARCYESTLSEYRFLMYGDTDLKRYLVLQARRRANYRDFAIFDWEAFRTKVSEELLRAAINRTKPQTLSV